MHSFSRKMMAGVAAILGAAFVCIGLFLYSMNHSLIEKAAFSNLQSALESISASAGYFLGDISAYRKNVIMDKKVSGILDGDPPETPGQKILLGEQLRQALIPYRVVKPYLADIVVRSADGALIANCVKGTEERMEEAFIDPVWGEEARPGNWYLLSPEQVVLSQYSGSRLLANRQSIYSYGERYRQTGTAYFLISTAVLDDIISGMPRDFCEYYIVDRDTGQILAASDGSAGALYEDAGRRGETTIEVPIAYAESHWSVYGRVYSGKIRESALRDILPILLVCAVTLVLAGTIVGLYVFARTKSVKKLAAAMNRVAEGDLDVSVEIRSRDEIQMLAETFNGMTVKIQRLILDVASEQRAKKNYQLRALMMQINPHFIYNTLNCVIYLSHMGRNADVEELCRSFIALLHDTIKWEDEWSTVEKELQYLGNYLVIQKIRYGEQFACRFEVEPRAMRARIPRMLLQPLVENSIFHGVLMREDPGEPGEIRICIGEREDGVAVAVEDNGAGAPMDQFFKAPSNSHDKMSGIGLANVRERLLALCGAELQIESAVGRGTRICFVIPPQDGGEGERRRGHDSSDAD